MVDRPSCPDCDSTEEGTPGHSRRRFLQVTGTAAAAGWLKTLPSPAHAEPTSSPSSSSARSSESLVKTLYDSLTPDQRKKICFAWDHTDSRGLLRTHVSNNWQIVDQKTLNVVSPFYTKDQQELIEAIFHSFYNPEWRERIHQQLKDDAGGYGTQQTIALFGEPGTGKFEFVMTGRHLTIRCDGDSTEHVAFGGPIFYGHAAKGFDETKDHPGNVFWPQALKANELFQMLDGKQRMQALVRDMPGEHEVAFKGKKTIDGIPVSELSADQKEVAQKVLKSLIEPYRTSDQTEALKCLETQGGIDACRLAFYPDDDIGDDKVWDVWRLEGPSFVWHYRGSPHVHVWVNVADDPSVPLNV